MGMYAKLMSRITESSLMDEEIPVRYCFVMLLAIADPHGYVVGTDVAISRRMNMPVEDFRKCVHQLMQPDPDSNSKEEEGRRVILSDCERGYYLVNYTKYRDTRDEEQRREYMRDYMRKYREGKDVTPVNKRKQRKPQLAKEEAEVDTDTKEEGRNKSKGSREQLRAYAESLSLPASDGDAMFDRWESNGWKTGGNPIKDWRAGIRTWKQNHWLPSQKLNGTSRQNASINPRVAGTANANMCDQYAGVGKVKGTSPGNGETSPPSV